jgi:hypothetical protein
VKSHTYWLSACCLAGLLWTSACAKKPAGVNTAGSSDLTPPAAATGASTAAAVPAEPVQPPAAAEVEIPAGTELQVRLAQPLGSAGSAAGEKFEATLNQPVVLGDRVVVPKGAVVRGHVVSAVASGRLRTPARLSITLDTLAWQDQEYSIKTTRVSRSAKSHKKRNLVLIGGGSGAGALIGGLAGGGTGALIGAAAGVGAGTAGAYATGKKDVLLPAEALLTFRLQAPVKIRKG